MDKQILSYCNANEVNNVASNILFEITKKDWGTDGAILGIVPRLEKENKLLTGAIGDLRKGKYTQDLHEADSSFDKNFSCVKQFVKANRFVQEEEVAEAAEIVWNVIEAHNLNLHRNGYEKQLSLIKSLLADFKKEELQKAIQKLYGVPQNILHLEKSTADFESLYRKNIEEGATEEESVAPSKQKLVVRKILNRELLPYLNAMAAVLPDEYEALAKVIGGYVERINTKARTRKKRNESVVES